MFLLIHSHWEMTLEWGQGGCACTGSWKVLSLSRSPERGQAREGSGLEKSFASEQMTAAGGNNLHWVLIWCYLLSRALSCTLPVYVEGTWLRSLVVLAGSSH